MYNFSDDDELCPDCENDPCVCGSDEDDEDFDDDDFEDDDDNE